MPEFFSANGSSTPISHPTDSKFQHEIPLDHSLRNETGFNEQKEAFSVIYKHLYTDGLCNNQSKGLVGESGLTQRQAITIQQPISGDNPNRTDFGPLIEKFQLPSRQVCTTKPSALRFFHSPKVLVNDNVVHNNERANLRSGVQMNGTPREPYDNNFKDFKQTDNGCKQRGLKIIQVQKYPVGSNTLHDGCFSPNIFDKKIPSQVVPPVNQEKPPGNNENTTKGPNDNEDLKKQGRSLDLLENKNHFFNLLVSCGIGHEVNIRVCQALNTDDPLILATDNKHLGSLTSGACNFLMVYPSNRNFIYEPKDTFPYMPVYYEIPHFNSDNFASFYKMSDDFAEDWEAPYTEKNHNRVTKHSDSTESINYLPRDKPVYNSLDDFLTDAPPHHFVGNLSLLDQKTNCKLAEADFSIRIRAGYSGNCGNWCRVVRIRVNDDICNDDLKELLIKMLVWCLGIHLGTDIQRYISSYLQGLQLRQGGYCLLHQHQQSSFTQAVTSTTKTNTGNNSSKNKAAGFWSCSTAPKKHDTTISVENPDSMKICTGNNPAESIHNRRISTGVDSACQETISVVSDKIAIGLDDQLNQLNFLQPTAKFETKHDSTASSFIGSTETRLPNNLSESLQKHSNFASKGSSEINEITTESTKWDGFLWCQQSNFHGGVTTCHEGISDIVIHSVTCSCDYCPDNTDNKMPDAPSDESVRYLSCHGHYKASNDLPPSPRKIINSICAENFHHSLSSCLAEVRREFENDLNQSTIDSILEEILASPFTDVPPTIKEEHTYDDQKTGNYICFSNEIAQEARINGNLNTPFQRIQYRTTEQSIISSPRSTAFGSTKRSPESELPDSDTSKSLRRGSEVDSCLGSVAKKVVIATKTTKKTEKTGKRGRKCLRKGSLAKNKAGSNEASTSIHTGDKIFPAHVNCQCEEEKERRYFYTARFDDLASVMSSSIVPSEENGKCSNSLQGITMKGKSVSSTFLSSPESASPLSALSTTTSITNDRLGILLSNRMDMKYISSKADNFNNGRYSSLHVAHQKAKDTLRGHQHETIRDMNIHLHISPIHAYQYDIRATKHQQNPNDRLPLPPSQSSKLPSTNVMIWSPGDVSPKFESSIISHKPDGSKITCPYPTVPSHLLNLPDRKLQGYDNNDGMELGLSATRGISLNETTSTYGTPLVISPSPMTPPRTVTGFGYNMESKSRPHNDYRTPVKDTSLYHENDGKNDYPSKMFQMPRTENNLVSTCNGNRPNLCNGIGIHQGTLVDQMGYREQYQPAKNNLELNIERIESTRNISKNLNIPTSVHTSYNTSSKPIQKYFFDQTHSSNQTHSLLDKNGLEHPSAGNHGLPWNMYESFQNLPKITRNDEIKNRLCTQINFPSSHTDGTVCDDGQFITNADTPCEYNIKLPHYDKSSKQEFPTRQSNVNDTQYDRSSGNNKYYNMKGLDSVMRTSTPPGFHPSESMCPSSSDNEFLATGITNNDVSWGEATIKGIYICTGDIDKMAPGIVEVCFRENEFPFTIHYKRVHGEAVRNEKPISHTCNYSLQQDCECEAEKLRGYFVEIHAAELEKLLNTPISISVPSHLKNLLTSFQDKINVVDRMQKPAVLSRTKKYLKKIQK